MGAVSEPVVNGVQSIVDINPFAGVLFGVLIAAVLYLGNENRLLRKEVKAGVQALLDDKAAQLAEAKKERELFERLADDANKRRRT